MIPNHAMAHGLFGVVQIFSNRAIQGIAECEQDAEYFIDTNANLDERLRRRRNIDQGNFLRTRRIRGSRDDDAASDGLVERFGLA
jgi:hypothetical protein